MENALIVYEEKQIVSAFSEGLDDFISKVRKEALSVVTDISTEKGRKEIASLAHKISKTKTGIDKVGKELKAEAKAKCDAIDADRGRAWDALQKLQDEVRKPLSDWENKEQARIDEHENALIRLASFKNWSIANAFGTRSTQDELRNVIKQSIELLENREWEEFSARAAMQFKANEEALNAALQERIKFDEEEAKAAELRKQEEEANEIAVVASEYVLTEITGLTQASLMFHHELKLADERKQAEIDAEMNFLCFASIVYDRTIQEGINRAKAEKAAAQKVIDDAAAAKKKEDDETAKREADKNHKKKINNEALDAIEEIYGAYHGEKNEELCRKIVEAIARGKVPHVSIKY